MASYTRRIANCNNWYSWRQVGGSDTFFLTNAVMDLQDWAADPALHPPFGGEILVGTHDGRGYEHCFNGYLPDGTPAPNAITRGRVPDSTPPPAPLGTERDAAARAAAPI